MLRSRALGASIAALGVAAAIALLPAAAASAHDYVVSTDPAADSTVTTALDKVTLTFNDRVLDLSGDGASSLVTVTGPDASSRHFETGCATTADRVVSAPVALGGAGRYTVTYQIVSADGHTVSDSLSFSYQPPAGSTPAAGSDTTTCGKDTPTPSPSGATTQTASPGAATAPTEKAGTAQPIVATASDGNLGLVIGIAVGIVVLAIAGVVIVVLTGRRRRGPPPADAAE